MEKKSSVANSKSLSAKITVAREETIPVDLSVRLASPEERIPASYLFNTAKGENLEGY